MKKLLYLTLVCAIALLCGTTIAYLTSSDDLSNFFASGQVEDELKPGANIIEAFEGSLNQEESKSLAYNGMQDHTEGYFSDDIQNYDGRIMPDEEIAKQTRVLNTANYSQFVKAKINVTFEAILDEEGYIDLNALDNPSAKIQQVTTYCVVGDKIKYLNCGADSIALSPEMISLTYGSGWTLAVDGYYYYDKVLESLDETNDLLLSAKLKLEAPNAYQNLIVNVEKEMESIQAHNGAATANGWDDEVPVSKLKGY